MLKPQQFCLPLLLYYKCKCKYRRKRKPWLHSIMKQFWSHKHSEVSGPPDHFENCCWSKYFLPEILSIFQHITYKPGSVFANYFPLWFQHLSDLLLLCIRINHLSWTQNLRTFIALVQLVINSCSHDTCIPM